MKNFFIIKRVLKNDYIICCEFQCKQSFKRYRPNFFLEGRGLWQGVNMSQNSIMTNHFDLCVSFFISVFRVSKVHNVYWRPYFSALPSRHNFDLYLLQVTKNIFFFCQTNIGRKLDECTMCTNEECMISF